MRVLLNKIGSVTRNLRLNREVTITSDIQAVEGAVLAARVLGQKSVYNQIEDVHGRMITLHHGDVIAGALGHRNALQGYEGVVPSRVERGDVLHLLNLGGVIGSCISHNPSVGKPFEVEVLGQVQMYLTFQSRRGEPAFAQMGALKDPGDGLRTPVIYVAGTCMNAGKTAAACSLIHQLSRAGYRVGGAKLTGVSLMRDKLSMLDYGAEAVDFTDAGSVCTTAEVAPTISRLLFSYLASRDVDVIVAEMGDGILGEYGVQALLRDDELMALNAGFILCANDPVGVYGGVDLLKAEYGIEVSVVSGPATDNSVGTRYVEQHVGLPAINARSHSEALGRHMVELLQSQTQRKATA